MRRETPMQLLKRMQAEGQPLIKWGKYIAIEKHSGAVGGRVVEAVREVTKMTPTQVVAGSERFYRADGRSTQPAFLSRGVARPATKKEYDAYCAKKNADAAERDRLNELRREVEESPENKLVSEILDDWDPNKRGRLRCLGKQQLTLALALLKVSYDQKTLDMASAVLKVPLL